MKAYVDHELCIGCGVCEAECPEVFSMNDQGLAEAAKNEIDGENPGKSSRSFKPVPGGSNQYQMTRKGCAQSTPFSI
jgi:ferredoxin